MAPKESRSVTLAMKIAVFKALGAAKGLGEKEEEEEEARRMVCPARQRRVSKSMAGSLIAPCRGPSVPPPRSPDTYTRRHGGTRHSKYSPFDISKPLGASEHVRDGENGRTESREGGLKAPYEWTLQTPDEHSRHLPPATGTTTSNFVLPSWLNMCIYSPQEANPVHCEIKHPNGVEICT